jgi:hypothetical protein
MLRRLLIALLPLSIGAAADILIRDTTVIDVSTGRALPGRSISIHLDKITAVGVELPTPKGAQVISGVGKFVIPGLWDMHVNLMGRDQLALYPAYGITGVRDMGSDFDRIVDWREEIHSGKLIGPHIESCGAPVDGFPSDDPRLPVRVVRAPGEARAMYDRLDTQSVDFIGILPRLPRDAYFALIERARKYYSPVAGPVPATVSAMEAVDARQKSIDEMSGILLACSTEERKLRAPRALALERNDLLSFQDLEAKASETFNVPKADELFKRMAMYETRSVPMLSRLRSSPYSKGQYGRLVQALVQMLHDGVVIMSGSGTGATGTHPGEDLHQELELLVASGLSPAQALRSATSGPAKYLDADESLGMIEPGRMADLLLLDADPLVDIRNTRKISGVVLGGKYLSKIRLTALAARK